MPQGLFYEQQNNAYMRNDWCFSLDTYLNMRDNIIMEISQKQETKQDENRSIRLAGRSLNPVNPGGGQVDAGTSDSPDIVRTQHTHRAA